MANDDINFPVNGYIPPAIPDGDHYQVVLLRAEQSSHWGGKIYLWFQMITPGEWHGKEFYMACPVAPKGRWKPSHKYWLMWVLAAGEQPTRTDRISTAVFRNKVFRVRMRKVLKTAKQTDRTPAQQYSVVDVLLEVLVGR